MFLKISRGKFILSFLASTLLPGCSDGENKMTCSDVSQEKIKKEILNNLKEKYPKYFFEISKISYDPISKTPFWYVQAITNISEKEMMIFAMRYCDGSIELTALTPRQA